ncbi:MAG TPA: hypothetical protein VFD32_18665 [Dehalococcoidia bacterium]|nr:hypothetical protein [Dehalococcoidia bacterium]
MPRPRTVLALLAVVMLSVMAARIRAVSVGGPVSHATAVISVDGAPETISVGLPSEALDELHGPVQVTVQAGAGHVLRVEEAGKGAFPLAIELSPAAGGNDELSVSADVKSDDPVEFGLAVSAQNAAPVAVHGSSAHPLVARLDLSEPPVAAKAP